MLSLALAACGGGGGGSSSEPQAQGSAAVPAPPTNPVLIEAYGDSTMAGLTYPDGPTLPSSVSPDNQPSVMQAELQSKYGSSVTVTNMGVSGTRAPQLVDGSDGVHLPWIQTVANSSAQIVIVNYGINDSFATSEGIDAYKAALRMIADTATQAGKLIVFEQPNPVCLSGLNNEEYSVLGTFAQAMAEIATEKSIPLVDNYEYVKSLPNWKDMLSDCTHPKAELYKIEAGRMSSVVVPLVDKLKG
jgi:lysophospholipase L1-like esterase